MLFEYMLLPRCRAILYKFQMLILFIFMLFQSPDESSRQIRLRNDSYIGAVHKENLLVRAGLQVVDSPIIDTRFHLLTFS